MRHVFQPGRRRSALIALLSLLGACAQEGPSRTPTAPRPLLSTDQTVLTAQLRTLSGYPVYAWGNLQIKVAMPGDACVPPNPIIPQDGYSNISICGRIFNQGGSLWLGGGIYDLLISTSDGGFYQVASFNTSAQPQDPYRRYDLSGYTTISNTLLESILNSPSRYAVIFDGANPSDPYHTITRYGGALDGTAWGPVGTIAETDAFFLDNAFTINFVPPNPI